MTTAPLNASRVVAALDLAIEDLSGPAPDRSTEDQLEANLVEERLHELRFLARAAEAGPQALRVVHISVEDFRLFFEQYNCVSM